MRSVAVAPSVVPNHDVVHIVLDDFGKNGRAWRETDDEWTDFETIVENILSGQYNVPQRVIAFDASEGWARDVTLDVAKEVKRRLSSGSSGDCAWKFLDRAGVDTFAF